MFLFRFYLALWNLAKGRGCSMHCFGAWSSVVLSASLVFPALGVRYTPGLQAGESAYYSIIGNYGYIPTEPVTQM
jgi:hypothetical protein